MKIGQLQISFCVSLGFHAAAVLGVVALGGFARRAATAQYEAPPITMTLVAAPEQPADSETAVENVGPAPTPLPPPAVLPLPSKEKLPEVPDVREIVQIADPPKLIAPREVIERSVSPIQQPVAPRPAGSKASGDGSSPQPGEDRTATKAQPGVVAHPSYLQNPEPPYPLLAQSRHQQGLVLLAVEVTAEGRAKSVSVKQSSGYPLLDEAALTAVGAWKFEPARVGAVAFESKIEVPVRFKL